MSQLPIVPTVTCPCCGSQKAVVFDHIAKVVVVRCVLCEPGAMR